MTDDQLAAYGVAVRRRRLSLGLNQGDLASRGGPGQVTVGLVERGQTTPSEATLYALDRALEWTAGTSAAMLAGHETPLSEQPLGQTVGPDLQSGLVDVADLPPADIARVRAYVQALRDRMSDEGG